MQRTFKPHAIALAVSSLCMLAGSHVAMADSSDDLLKKLKDKGILTEQEYDEFNATRDTEKVKKLSEIKASFKDGIVWESGDGQHSMQVEGRLHFDFHEIGGNYARVSDPDTATIADQFEIRRARLGVKGKFYTDYTYEIQTNMVGGSANLVDQAWVNVGWWKEAQFRFGRYKEPFNLEKMTSSNNIDFNERSFVNQLAPNEVLGAMVWGTPIDGTIYQLNAFQKDFSETDNANNDLFFGGRVAANVAKLAGWGNNTVLHVGFSGYDGEWSIKPVTSSQPASTSTTRSTFVGFRTEGRGLNNIYRAQISGDNTLAILGGVGGSSISDADIEQSAKALELAAAYGPFKLQGEFARASFHATHTNTGANVQGDVDAWYAEALWMLTGENYSDTYKDGAWGTMKPKNEFVHPSVALSTGGFGAWELGLRYSKLDASDLADNITASATKGTGTRTQGSPMVNSYTAGIKWILNPNVRFLMDYTHSIYDTHFAPIDVTTPANVAVKPASHEDALTVRGQISF